jgi:hypothetical protein
MAISLKKKKPSSKKIIIENYGLYWERESVSWSGTSKSLMGKLSKTGTKIDFCNQRGIYCLYTEDFRLVYVGQTGSGNDGLLKRLTDHTKTKISKRWTKFSWFGTCAILKTGKISAPNKAKNTSHAVILDQLEAILISASEPNLNLQGGRFGSAKKYLQHESQINIVSTDSNKLDEVLTLLKKGYITPAKAGVHG